MNLRLVALLGLAALAPAAALAHGGSYSGPAVPGGAPGGPQVPPGTADPPAPTTRWETWWAANKEAFLRLNEVMREDVDPTSQAGGVKAKPDKSAKELRELRDAATRDALVPVFIEALADESFEVRTAAVIALGKSGGKQGGAALRKMSSEDKHKDVRDSALLGLGLLGRDTDIPFLDARLHDEKDNTRHRSFAAFALGLIGGEDAAAALLAFAEGSPDRPSTFDHEQAPLIASTFVAMGLTGDARVVPTLRQALTNPRFDDNVRAFVVLSLGRLKDRGSLADFGAMLAVERPSSKEVGLRRSAAIALGKIATAADQGAVDALCAAAKGDPDESVRHFAAVALGGMADAAIKKRLESMFEESALAGRPFIALALAIAHDTDAAPAIREALGKETDESTKSSYCIALGLLGDKASAPLVEKQLQDRGRIWLQGYAALALGLMHNVESVELLNARLTTDNDPRLRGNLAVALGLMHDPRSKAWLVATLKKNDATVYERGGAAMGLGVLRLNEAVPEIVDVYRDKKEHEMVRAFAVVSLGLIADPSPVPKLSRFAIDNNYTLAIDPLNEVLSIL
jgi:HEAT repeat protein